MLLIATTRGRLRLRELVTLQELQQYPKLIQVTMAVLILPPKVHLGVAAVLVRETQHRALAHLQVQLALLQPKLEQEEFWEVLALQELSLV